MADFRPSHGTVRFSAFELDQDAGELRKDGIKVRLQEQPLQILQILLEHPVKIIPREELRKRIWPSDTFVDFDHGINNAVKRLREALADNAETPRFIETLPRRGYRFIPAIEVARHPGVERVESLAVLPLENLSHDPEQEYFTDGLTEALIMWPRLGLCGSCREPQLCTTREYIGLFVKSRTNSTWTRLSKEP